jgi:SOS-response transcriptional repressor LexA
MRKKTVKAAARMAQVYDFLKKYKSNNDGCAPSLSEIGEAVGITTDSHVKVILRDLEAAGLIFLGEKAQPRYIRVKCGVWSCEDVSQEN